MSGHADSRAVDVIDGGLVKPMIVLSIPIVLTNLLQVGYNLADTFWVGRLGQPPVAALSFSWAIIFLIISLSVGFSVAGTVLVAQHKGAGHQDRVSQVAGQTFTLLLGVSLVLSLIGFVLAPELLRLVGAAPGSAEHRLAVAYTRTMFIGIPAIFGFFVFQSLLQGWGDTRTPLYLMALGVGLNVVIDPFFILGFQENVVFAWFGLDGLEAALFERTGFAGLGVQGAAVATILSRGVGAVIGLWLLLSGAVGIELAVPDFVPTRETVRKIVTIGVPASLEISTKALSMTILIALVALTGAEAVAAYGIGTRITSIVVLPALGLARGVETVVGQNLGADQVDRAKRGVFSAIAIIVLCLAVLSVGVYAFAEAIMSVFIEGTGAATVVDIGTGYLRIVGASYVFLGAFYMIQGGYRGSGSTRLAMVFAFIGFILLRAVLAYGLALPLGLGATGIWFGEATANVAMVVIAGAYFLRGTWTDHVVEHPPRGPAAGRNVPEPPETADGASGSTAGEDE